MPKLKLQQKRSGSEDSVSSIKDPSHQHENILPVGGSLPISVAKDDATFEEKQSRLLDEMEARMIEEVRQKRSNWQKQVKTDCEVKL